MLLDLYAVLEKIETDHVFVLNCIWFWNLVWARFLGYYNRKNCRHQHIANNLRPEKTLTKKIVWVELKQQTLTKHSSVQNFCILYVLVSLSRRVAVCWAPKKSYKKCHLVLRTIGFKCIPCIIKVFNNTMMFWVMFIFIYESV